MTKGWKTSEFWLTALFNLSALLTVVAGLVPSGAAPLVVAAAGIVTALYNFGRSLVKADAAKATMAKVSTPPAGATVLGGSVAPETIGTANAPSAAIAPGTVPVPQRRATDKIGREVAEVLERAAVTATLQSGLAGGAMGSVLGTVLAGSGTPENALAGPLSRKEAAPVSAAHYTVAHDATAQDGTAQDGTAQNTVAQAAIVDEEAGSEVFDERNAG